MMGQYASGKPMSVAQASATVQKATTPVNKPEPLATATPRPLSNHDVDVIKMTDVSQKFPFLVNCKTCGWQARVMTQAQADSMKQNHINARNAMSGGSIPQGRL
ncbi:MAG: hypothetical protein WA766_07545 [Candidatus Acidiferrales bacterium]